MPLKRCFSVLLALSLLFCLCGCEEEEPKNTSVIPRLVSICAVADTVYVLRRNDYITTEHTIKVQYELDAVTEDGTTNINVFPTGVRMVFHPAGEQCLCVKDGRLLSYTLPKGETKAVCEVGESAAILCVTENYALLDDRTLVELNTAAIRTTEQLPSESFRILDVLDDCIYFWYDAMDAVCRYDCAADTVSTVYSRERKPSVSMTAGKVWGDNFLFCEGNGLRTIPLAGGEPELAIKKPYRIAAIARCGDDLYLAAQRMQDDLGFYRLTPDGTVTELGAWDAGDFYVRSCHLSVTEDLLACALTTTGPEVFLLPLSEDAPPEETKMLIESPPKEGRALQPEYELPEEVFEGVPDDTEAPLKLAAYPDNSIDLYGVYEAGKNEYNLIVEWEELSRQFDISYLGTGGIDLHSAVWDADGDGADELVLTELLGSGTGVFVENLHVIEKTETSLSLYSLHCDALAPQMREWIPAQLDAEARTLRIGGETFRIPDHADPSRFAVGNIVSFETEDPQICMSAAIQFEPAKRDKAFSGFSYAIRLSADVVFSDGTFSLQNFHAAECS